VTCLRHGQKSAAAAIREHLCTSNFEPCAICEQEDAARVPDPPDVRVVMPIVFWLLVIAFGALVVQCRA
jgi:hypothetical protein